MQIDEIKAILIEKDFVNEKDYLDMLKDDEPLKKLINDFPNFYDIPSSTNKIANLSWRFKFSPSNEEQFNIMADGYYEITLEMITRCLSDNVDKKSDIWIFSILYNIAHCIELKLKAIYLIILKKENEDFDCQKLEHKWLVLIDKLLSYYENQQNKNAEYIISLNLVKEFLETFLSQSDNISFMRYPINKKNEKNFYNEEGCNVILNINLLKNEFILCYDLLDFIIDSESSVPDA